MSVTDSDRTSDGSRSRGFVRMHRLVSDGSGSTYDRFFRLLTEQRRRFVLYYLSELDDEIVAVDDLVSRIVTWETEGDPPDLPEETYRNRVIVDLKHHHLPKLDEHGVIDYDERSETIRNCEELLHSEWLECVKAAELE